MLDNTFQLPWLTPVVDNFKTIIESKKMPHALLIHGNQGIGKRSLANEIGALILCQSPRNNRACGECKTCYLREAGTHPDCFDIGVEDGKKQIAIDQIRELMIPSNNGISKLHSRAMQTGWNGAWKVIIIDPAEVMNINAANSLLKILEEPPVNTLFILVSSYSQMILPTIRSRCQQFLLPPPSKEQAKDWLRSQSVSSSNVDDDLVEHYLDKPLDLVRLVEDNLVDKRLKMKVLCQQMLNSASSVSEYAVELASDKEHIIDYMNWFAEEIHQQLKIQMIEIQESTDNNRFIKLNRMLDIIQQHIREAHYGSINLRLFWETILLQWQQYNQQSKQ